MCIRDRPSAFARPTRLTITDISDSVAACFIAFPDFLTPPGWVLYERGKNSTGTVNKAQCYRRGKSLLPDRLLSECVCVSVCVCVCVCVRERERDRDRERQRARTRACRSLQQGQKRELAWARDRPTFFTLLLHQGVCSMYCLFVCLFVSAPELKTLRFT